MYLPPSTHVREHGKNLAKAGYNWVQAGDIEIVNFVVASKMENHTEATYMKKNKNWLCSQCLSLFTKRFNCVRHINVMHSTAKRKQHKWRKR